MSVYHWNGTDEVPYDVEEVVVNSGVTEIPDFAFSNRSELRSIGFTTPDTLTRIGYYAFADCDKLASITIPKNVTTIGDGAFSFSSGLMSIVVDSGNPNYSSESSILYNKVKTKLIQFPVGRACYDKDTNPNPTTSVTIRDSVVEICDHAFNDCTSLKSVSSGYNLKVIGDYTFSGCSSLESVALDEGLTNIGTCAFYDCTKLSSILVPKSVVSIEPRALGYCNMGGKYSPFWIRGYARSNAETYAKSNSVKFIEIFVPIYPTGIAWVKDRIVNNVEPGDTYTLPSEGTAVADIYVTVKGESVRLVYPDEYTISESGSSITVTFLDCENMRNRDSKAVKIKMGYTRPQTIINVGETKTCEACVLPPNATYRDIIYESSNINYLITGDGTVTALKIGTSDGDYIPVTPTVSARAAYGDHPSVSCTWKVIKKVEEVQLSELPAMTAGKVQRISASLHPVDPAGNNITTTRQLKWFVADSSVAEIIVPGGTHVSDLTYRSGDAVPLTATCQIVPKQPGTTKITARAVDFDGQTNGVFAESTLTVEKPRNSDAQIVVKGSGVQTEISKFSDVYKGKTVTINVSEKIVDNSVKCRYLKKGGTSSEWVTLALTTDYSVNYNAKTITLSSTSSRIPASGSSEVSGNTLEVTCTVMRYCVELFLKNNPGIVGLNLWVKYDSSLIRLASMPTEYQVKDGENLFNAMGQAYHSNNLGLNPYRLSWANDILTENKDANGKIVTLQFKKVDEDASTASEVPITIFYDDEDFDIYNSDLNLVSFAVDNSTVKTNTNVLYGDVNNDKHVNKDDVTTYNRYLSKWNGYSSINEAAAELTGDGKMTHKDSAVLARYVDSSTTRRSSFETTITYTSEVTLPEDAIDRTDSISPVDHIEIEISDYKKLTSEPKDWDTDYKGYYELDDDEYVNVSGDSAPPWQADKYYDLVKTDKMLQEGKKHDYSLSDDGKTITFHKSKNIQEDTDYPATIFYRVYSPWKSTIYSMIPLDN